MTEDEWLDWTLVWTTSARVDGAADWANTQEIDTSCPWVPFGLVRQIRKSLTHDEDARDFWAACIGDDELVDPLRARLTRLEPHRLVSILEVIMRDLQRVKKSMSLAAAGEWTDVFQLSNGCDCCSGAILLMQSSSDAAYLHWHRES